MEDAQSNKYLLAIAKIAGINKHITFHSARHTFSINSLLLGIKIEVVSDILGHSELTTTQRYARVIDKLREKEMDKWDQMVLEESGATEEINCPNCDFVVIRFERGVIELKKLACKCPACETRFISDLKSEQTNLRSFQVQNRLSGNLKLV